MAGDDALLLPCAFLSLKPSRHRTRTRTGCACMLCVSVVLTPPSKVAPISPQPRNAKRNDQPMTPSSSSQRQRGREREERGACKTTTHTPSPAPTTHLPPPLPLPLGWPCLGPPALRPWRRHDHHVYETGNDRPPARHAGDPCHRRGHPLHPGELQWSMMGAAGD